ncbi:MAG: family 43 glycosylhydrolase [Clostridia bacterium]|nr:family 43 glycosylhydrolase [Clostridia bacterium]
MLKRVMAIMLAVFMMIPAFSEDYVNPQTVEGQYAPISGASDDYGVGDPFVMRFNGTYYLYPSSCEDRVKVYTSKDLVNWKYEGYCTKGRDVYFAYAPEVTYWRGHFYMITSPNGGGHYILKSDSPLGPFEPVTKNFGHSIDGSFFKLDDGRIMILYPDNWIIKSKFLDENTMLPESLASSTGATLRHWTEGPGLFRRGDWYYLTFTGNHVCSTGYQVAFASRKGGPRGAFAQREDSTLLINSVFGDEFKGLGHSSNVVGPDLDSMYIAYHSLVSLAGPARLYNLDRLFTNGGLLYTTGPSNTEMPVPEMPDAYGDARAELNDFAETSEGYFAKIEKTVTFTQEANFALNGNTALWLMGEKDGKDVKIEVSQTTMKVFEGEDLIEEANLPEIGHASALHTLRIENTQDITYFYIDEMRVITLENAGIECETFGAYKNEGVEYSFMAATGEALGSSDNTALKRFPGAFSAIHALNADELTYEKFGGQEEKAPVLGKADYAVRVTEDGMYAFDFTVRKEDEGRTISIAIDGETLLSVTVPKFSGRGKTFTFTTESIKLTKGDHTLTLISDGAAVNRVGAFIAVPAEPFEIDFTDNALRSAFVTYGPFMMKPSEGVLRISPGRNGFAVFGDEGNTDYQMDVTFRLPDKGDGGSGILLRATDVSIYDLQVEDSYFGYSVAISRLGVSLRRSRYGLTGSVSFEQIPEWKTAETASLHIEAEGNKVRVYLPGEEEPLLALEDSMPFTHGMYGFFSNGTELTILDMKVSPLND